jgi:hypothetical protein
MKQNKTYYGYKPKESNLVKLQRYLLDKTTKQTETTHINDRVAKLSTNKVLQNKRF